MNPVRSHQLAPAASINVQRLRVPLHQTKGSHSATVLNTHTCLLALLLPYCLFSLHTALPHPTPTCFQCAITHQSMFAQVPVYHFGNSACLSFGPKFLEPWGRKWRFALGLLYGIALLPIPRRVRLLMTVGAPVKVDKVSRSDPGFAAAVDATHQRYMEALQALYDKHKARYGWADHPLIMH